MGIKYKPQDKNLTKAIAIFNSLGKLTEFTDIYLSATIKQLNDHI